MHNINKHEPGMVGRLSRRIASLKVCLGQLNETVSKKEEWGWGCSSVVERLPSRRKTLGLNLTTVIKKKKVREKHHEPNFLKKKENWKKKNLKDER
jgi:hypothetical protein